jgi:hypothetical protein
LKKKISTAEHAETAEETNWNAGIMGLSLPFFLPVFEKDAGKL